MSSGVWYKIPVSRWNKFYGDRGRFKTVHIVAYEDRATAIFAASTWVRVLAVVLAPVYAPVLGLMYGIPEVASDLRPILLGKPLAKDEISLKTVDDLDKFYRMVGDKREN